MKARRNHTDITDKMENLHVKL